MLSAHFLLITALAANPDLEKATRLVGDLQYAEARSALEAAIKRGGNDRDTVLRIYELQGIVYATLNDAGKAGKAFQALLVMDPEHKLTGDYPPRVMTPFYEARGRASDLGKLDVKALPAAIAENRVAQLAVEIANDPMKMVKKVKFHVRSDGGAWVETPGDLVGKTASVSVDAKKVEWWADAIGDREAIFAQVGTEAEPKVDTGAPPVVAAPEKPVALTPQATGEPTGVTKEGPGMSGLRLASIAIAVVGVGGVALGVVFGLMASSARAKIDRAETNAMGQVTSITQKEAFALDAQVKTNATIANVAYGLGGALIATGVVLFLVGGSASSPSAALVPTGNGFAFSGTW